MSLWWDLPHPNILLYLLQIYISRKYYRYNFSPLWKQDIFTQRQIRQRNFSHNILKTTWPYKISAVVISFIKQRGEKLLLKSKSFLGGKSYWFLEQNSIYSTMRNTLSHFSHFKICCMPTKWLGCVYVLRRNSSDQLHGKGTMAHNHKY